MNKEGFEDQKKPLLLIVDDIPINIEILYDLLSPQGYEIAAAVNGQEALELINKVLPDLILLDVVMPEMDGFEVCKQLKASPITKDIPIIFLTAKNETEDLIKGFDIGAVDYVTKPFNFPELLARVHTHLELKNARDTQKRLISKLQEKTQEVLKASEILEIANKNITESIQYARMIQTSLLPNPKNIRTFFPNSFFIWRSRDIVGGDFIFIERVEEGLILGVIDCTGHGVPGAFMTLITCFVLKQLIKDEGHQNPGQILNCLNFIIKTTLQQDRDNARSDDGLDAGICFINLANNYSHELIFAGARLPLYYVHHNKINVIKGDRGSVGYKRSDLNFQFTNHKIHIEKGMSFYLTTDGFIDQLGGKRGCRFGSRCFRQLLQKIQGLPFDRQRELLIQIFNEHRGEKEIQDDVTLVGFEFNN